MKTNLSKSLIWMAVILAVGVIVSVGMYPSHQLHIALEILGS